MQRILRKAHIVRRFPRRAKRVLALAAGQSYQSFPLLQVLITSHKICKQEKRRIVNPAKFKGEDLISSMNFQCTLTKRGLIFLLSLDSLFFLIVGMWFIRSRVLRLKKLAALRHLLLFLNHTHVCISDKVGLFYLYRCDNLITGGTNIILIWITFYECWKFLCDYGIKFKYVGSDSH